MLTTGYGCSAAVAFGPHPGFEKRDDKFSDTFDEGNVLESHLLMDPCT